MRRYYPGIILVSTASVGVMVPGPPISLALAQAQPILQTSARDESVKRFLQAFDSERIPDKPTKYVAAFYDLNGDGKTEAIIYLSGGWCGTGGCTTLILAEDGSSWRIVSKQPITRPPIRVLASTSNGWHSIGVWTSGGGIQAGYESELRFDGETYQIIPHQTRKSIEEPRGEAIISQEQWENPLYP